MLIINREATKCKTLTAKTGLGLPNAIATVVHALKKVSILEVNENGILLKEALLVYVRHDVGRLKRTLGL